MTSLEDQWAEVRRRINTRTEGTTVTSVSGTNRRAQCLQTAERLVNGERNTQYDEPSADFKRFAGLMSAYFGIEVTMTDVAATMCMLKLACIRFAPTHADNWADLAGYAACGYDVSGAEL